MIPATDFFVLLLLATVAASNPEGNEKKYIDTHEDGDAVIVEGDIMLTPAQAAIYRKGGWNALVKSNAWEAGHGLWSRTIPYTLETLQNNVLIGLSHAINMFEKNSCLRFVPKKQYHKYYIRFYDEKKGLCYAGIGKGASGYETTVSLTSHCGVGGTAAHEIFHALGRLHEQNRRDKENYVDAPGYKSVDNSDSQSLPYDYLSIMHYGESNTNDPKYKLIVKHDYPNLILTGQNSRLSLYDVQHVNIRYCPEKTIRLVGGSAPNIGRVEVLWNGQWGTICADYLFDRVDAEVICKYMGFEGVKLHSIPIYSGLSQGTGPIWFGRMNCVGDEHSPFSCNKEIGISGGTCSHFSDVTIECFPNIRLIDKPQWGNNKEGIVEVYLEKQWGLLCLGETSHFVANINANVICRQLGYSSAWSFYTQTASISLPMLMEDIQCFGDETQIAHCPSGSPIGDVNLSQCSQAFGVRCT